MRQPPCKAEGSFKDWQKVISQPHVGGPGREPTRLAGGDKNAETCGNGHQNQLLQQSHHQGSTTWTATKALPVLWHQNVTYEEMSWRPLLWFWLLPFLKKSQLCARAPQRVCEEQQPPQKTPLSLREIPRDLLQSDPKGAPCFRKRQGQLGGIG